MPGIPTRRVFLTASAEDPVWVSQLAAALLRAGVQVAGDAPAPGYRELSRDTHLMVTLWDRTRGSLADAAAESDVEEAMRSSETLVAALDARGEGSPGLHFAVGAALAGRKQIITVVPEDLSPERLPRLLRRSLVVRASSAEIAAGKIAALMAGTLPAPPLALAAGA